MTPYFNIDFLNIDYLKAGNPRQMAAYQTLTHHRIMEGLQQYDPILAGTIPISIDIANSDLDVICCYKELGEFASTIKELFGQMEGFVLKTCEHQNTLSVKANFRADNFEIEVFAQNIPTRLQNAYRHMVIEHRLLNERGEPFRQEIIKLKQQGYKTEPAFASLLGIEGDPYLGLLALEKQEP